MQKLPVCWLTAFLLSVCFSGQAQIYDPANEEKVDTVFHPLVRYFIMAKSRPSRPDTIRISVPDPIYATTNFKVVLADSAWNFSKQKRLLTNPFGSDKYPLSYSVLYQNNLVSLCAPGYFVCHSIDSWQRNLTLEKQLNTRRFERHCQFDGQLIGFAGKRYWQFTSEKGWRSYKGEVPFKNRPKLFEDDTYLVYSECRGEFGGQVYFYNKQTHKTHWTEATCAVWVRSTSAGYEVLSSLGHMMGSASRQLIKDPDALQEWTGTTTAKTGSGGKFQKPISLFSFPGLQLFGGLERQGRILYLLHVSGRTCLATLSGDTFTIVDPLFNDNLYTHEPVSAGDQATAIINLDFYGLGGHREVACLVLKNNQITFAAWPK